MLPQVNDILFATDLSPNADNALRFALGIAQAIDAKVHVLHVLEPLSADAVATINLFMQDSTMRSKAIKDRHAGTKEMLKQNQKQFLDGLSDEEKQTYKQVGSVELVDGHPAEMIMRRAGELNCGMIVMGSHEYATGQTFLGTVAKRVLRRATIPVLIVPQGD